MTRTVVLLAGFLSAAAAFGQEGGDSLRRLAADESPEAGQRVSRLYHATANADQRFWLVQVLGQRLRDHSDLAAFDALVSAAQEPEAGVRGAALRALTAFDGLPREDLDAERIGKIETVVQLGIDTPAGAVRDAATELERALRLFKDPDSRKTPAPPTEEDSPRADFWARAAGLFKWVWIFLFPLVGGAWAWAGAPVFENEGREGRVASAAFTALSRQYLFLAVCGFVWVSLASLVGGYGFYAMAEILGQALYPPPGSWIAFYAAAGFCILLPAAAAAAGLARRPEGNLFVNAARSLPWAFLFGAVALAVFVPVEVFYRLFLRRPRKPAGDSDAVAVLLKILDAGSFRSALFAAAIASREGRGVWPALVKAGEFLPAEKDRRDFGLAGFDARFILLCGTPAMALLCSLVAQGMPVRWSVGWPVILLGCAVWAWGVLSAVLFAIVQTLSGVDAAMRVVRAAGGGLPDSFAALEAVSDVEDGDD